MLHFSESNQKASFLIWSFKSRVRLIMADKRENADAKLKTHLLHYCVCCADLGVFDR